jgi:hypothetical protein
VAEIPPSSRFFVEGPRGEVEVVSGFGHEDILDWCQGYEPWRMWMFCGGKPTIRAMTEEEDAAWRKDREYYS